MKNISEFFFNLARINTFDFERKKEILKKVNEQLIINESTSRKKIIPIALKKYSSYLVERLSEKVGRTPLCFGEVKIEKTKRKSYYKNYYKILTQDNKYITGLEIYKNVDIIEPLVGKNVLIASRGRITKYETQDRVFYNIEITNRKEYEIIV